MNNKNSMSSLISLWNLLLSDVKKKLRESKRGKRKSVKAIATYIIYLACVCIYDFVVQVFNVCGLSSLRRISLFMKIHR